MPVVMSRLHSLTSDSKRICPALILEKRCLFIMLIKLLVGVTFFRCVELLLFDLSCSEFVVTLFSFPEVRVRLVPRLERGEVV